MQNKYLIARLIAEYLCGNREHGSTPEFEAWRKDAHNERLLRKIEQDSHWRIETNRYADFSCQEGWEQLQAKRVRLRRRRLIRRMSASAAIVALFLGVTLFLYWQTGSKTEAGIAVPIHQIAPGSPKARLILGGGEQIDLVRQQGVIGDSLACIRNTGRCLTYRADSSGRKVRPVYHELIVPVCGEYQLQLSDGTRVYLNAMSKLRFPNVFEGDAREVELEGEAYFKVTKNPERPFIVKSANSLVYVYGTQFNVSAYPDGTTVHTTLVEGKLAVENAGRRREIKPGEQWCYHKGSGEVTVEGVDVSLYTAWKDGRLRFNDARLEEIMQTVARWYGVEISYQSEALKELRFGCNFNRHESIEPLLRIFETNGKINIERKGNQLKIKRGR